MKVAHIFQAEVGSEVPLPLYTDKVPAGFPSPAEDYIDSHLDLNRHIIQNPAATYFVRVSGDSMEGAGIFSGDLLVVDRSLQPGDKDIVVAAVDGELLVKRLEKCRGQVRLLSENPSYPPINLADGQDLVVWGVVTTCVHSLR